LETFARNVLSKREPREKETPLDSNNFPKTPLSVQKERHSGADVVHTDQKLRSILGENHAEDVVARQVIAHFEETQRANNKKQEAELEERLRLQKIRLDLVADGKMRRINQNHLKELEALREQHRQEIETLRREPLGRELDAHVAHDEKCDCYETKIGFEDEATKTTQIEIERLCEENLAEPLYRPTSVTETNAQDLPKTKQNETTVLKLSEELKAQRKRVQLLVEEKKALARENAALQDKYSALLLDTKIHKVKQREAAIEEEVLKRTELKMKEATKQMELRQRGEARRQAERARNECNQITKDRLMEQEKLHAEELEDLKASCQKKVDVLKKYVTAGTDPERRLVESDHHKLAHRSSILVVEIQKLRQNVASFEEALENLREDANETILEDVFRSLGAHVRNIELDIISISELVYPSEEADKATKLVRLRTKPVAIDKMKEADQHAKELDELKVAQREQVRKLQEEIDSVKEKERKSEIERKRVVDASLILDSNLRQARTVRHSLHIYVLELGLI